MSQTRRCDIVAFVVVTAGEAIVTEFPEVLVTATAFGHAARFRTVLGARVVHETRRNSLKVEKTL